MGFRLTEQEEAFRKEWCFLLARTNLDAPKKHQGLSFFLIDLKSRGDLRDNEGGDSHERIKHAPCLRQKGGNSYEF